MLIRSVANLMLSTAARLATAISLADMLVAVNSPAAQLSLSLRTCTSRNSRRSPISSDRCHASHSSLLRVSLSTICSLHLLRLLHLIENLAVAVDCARQLILKLLGRAQFLIHQADQLIVLRDSGLRAQLERLRFEVQNLGLVQACLLHEV